MKTVQFITEARAELLTETEHYTHIQPVLGDQFVAAIEPALAIALAFPTSGSPAMGGSRKIVVKKFPFSVFYLAVETGIVVIAVAHHARKPNYWKSRV